jgi:hypothetical protein
MRLFKISTVALLGLFQGLGAITVARAAQEEESVGQPAPPPTPAAQVTPAPEAIPGPPIPDAVPGPPAPATVRPTMRSARVVVIPVTVGNGPKPSDEMLSAIGDGMSGNVNWHIEVARKGKPIAVTIYDDFDAELVQRLEASRSAVEVTDPAAVEKYEALLAEAEAALATRPMGALGRGLVVRLVDSLIAATLASGDQQKAKSVAEHAALLFPGRRPTVEEGVSVVASALIGQAAPPQYAKLQFLSRPEGCMVEVNGADVGAAPVTVAAAPGVTYHARARCPKDRGDGVSMRKAVPAGPVGEGRSVVLDVQFEHEFINDTTGTVMSFGSSNARRELEQSYARRIAEKLSADTVVFVSLGEVGGSEYLNARAYLRSGFKNRQGLARPEVGRASALGHYLVSGQDDGATVLRPEDIGKTGATDIALPNTVRQPLVRAPWYTDVPAWVLVGTGALGVAGGLYADDLSDDKRKQAGAAKDPFTKDRLEGDSSNLRFLANVGIFAGGMMVVTGALLLLTPEYRVGQSELFVLSPSVGTDGAGLRAVGRF